MIDEPFKLGIIGCAEILSRAIINPLKEIDTVIAYGIASRNKLKAENHAGKFNIRNVFDYYDDILKCKEIDCVYIALPNDLHLEWIVKSAQAKKHILVEKPLCLKSSDFQIIESVCRDNNVHLLEGLMVQHHPWQNYISEIIDNKQFGNLKNITTQLCIVPKDNFKGNYRSIKEKGGGSFLDLGCYWIQFIQKIIGFDDLSSCFGQSDFSGPDECDWTFTAGMSFKSGIEANFISSFELPYKSNHILEFENARILIKDFFRANLGNFNINIQIEKKNDEKEKIVFKPQCYYTNQLIFFANVLKGREKNINLKQSFDRIHLLELILSKAHDRRLERIAYNGATIS
jgi:dTDP-3,4-didehydro-2,6-dideoxy-alpha-D-glucose 3-reductase